MKLWLLRLGAWTSLLLCHGALGRLAASGDPLDALIRGEYAVIPLFAGFYLLRGALYLLLPAWIGASVAQLLAAVLQRQPPEEAAETTGASTP